MTSTRFQSEVAVLAAAGTAVPALVVGIGGGWLAANGYPVALSVAAAMLLVVYRCVDVCVRGGATITQDSVKVVGWVRNRRVERSMVATILMRRDGEGEPMGWVQTSDSATVRLAGVTSKHRHAIRRGGRSCPVCQADERNLERLAEALAVPLVLAS